MSFIKTSVNLEPEQIDFLKSSGYSISKLVRLQVSKLMKDSEDQDMRVPQSSEEPLTRSSNID